MIKITHNNRCSKSRNTLNILQESGVDFEIVHYLNGVLSKKDLQEILEKLAMSPEQITRKGEKIFKEKFKESAKNFSENDWICMLVENPSLIERPIIWNEKTAIIGRPPEKVTILLDQWNEYNAKSYTYCYINK